MLCKREASWIDRTPARSIFHVYVCINIDIGLGGRGGELVESNSSFGKYYDPGDS